jgi:hypothetical protein
MRTTFGFLLLACAMPVAAVEIDGRIDEAEWTGAQRVTDFRLTEPLSREPLALPTEALILATQDGLAIGFRNTQPPGVPRNRQRGQRDNGGAVDRVNLYVDFDGDGRTGYNFTVTLANSINDTTITNENQFNSDWDGDFRHATSEDEQAWYVEMLIPWHIAPMREASGGQRTLRIGLDRVVAETGQRASWPAVGFTEPRFLTRLQPVTVPAYSQSLLAVTPYVSGIHANGELDRRGSDFDAGADLFWKPNGRFQLSAALNPDFGQVESDELVVNFSATETFFSDKRPFFTENQGFFDVPFGSLNQRSRLLYTRRVSGDVTAAVKVNGSLGAFNYGVFAADEDDGRDFYAVRATRDFEGGERGDHGLGAMATRVETPFLDRTANVYEADHRWSSTRWNVRSTVVASDVAQGGVSLRDSGAQVIVDYDMQNDWRQQLYALHIGRDFQLNDFGYLERNNFNYLRYDLGRRVTDLPETSAYSGHDWHYAASYRSNDQGERIAWAAALNRQSNRRDGGNEFFDVAMWSRGQDDLIMRGNGIVEMPAKLYAYYERFRPRKGAWQLSGSARYAGEGLQGPGRGGVTLSFEPTYFVNDALSFGASLELSHNEDWLLWRNEGRPQGRNNLLATYRSDLAYLAAGATWLIDPRQELRVRLEAIGLDAEAVQAWRVAGRTAVASDEAVPDFSVRNLGFQVRYRYELAPLSYLYIAYVRGGSLFQEALGGGPGDPFGVGSEFRDAFDLRDSEQLLVKLSYRFEL